MSRALVAVLGVLAACTDPVEPIVSGTAAITPLASPSDYSVFAIRLYDGSFFPSEYDVPLPMSFPAPFVAGDVAHGRTGSYSVRVWLAKAENELNPAQGAPWGEQMVMISCPQACVPVTGVELLLYPH